MIELRLHGVKAHYAPTTPAPRKKEHLKGFVWRAHLAPRSPARALASWFRLPPVGPLIEHLLSDLPFQIFLKDEQSIGFEPMRTTWKDVMLPLHQPCMYLYCAPPIEPEEQWSRALESNPLIRLCRTEHLPICQLYVLFLFSSYMTST